MVVPIGITMTTTVIKEPRHSLLRMFVHQENRIHGNTNHTTDILEALHRATFGCKSRQMQLQVAHTRHIGILRCSQASCGTTTTATAATAATAAARAIAEVNASVIPKGEDICSIHFGNVLVEAKAAPFRFRTVSSDM